MPVRLAFGRLRQENCHDPRQAWTADSLKQIVVGCVLTPAVPALGAKQKERALKARVDCRTVSQ